MTRDYRFKTTTADDSAPQARIELDGRFFGIDPEDLARAEHERGRIVEELKELTQLGLQITQFVLPKDGGPPRYAFRFPDGELQYKTRGKLERAGFDVGQQLGDRRLAFYVSRRSQKSEGWEV
jgi:hypothetical protein